MKLKLFNIYTKDLQRFEPAIIHEDIIQQITRLSKNILEAPQGTKTVIHYEDGVSFTNETVEEIYSRLMGH